MHSIYIYVCRFFDQSYLTGNDYFVLPPSGDLYSYPGQMPSNVQASFVTNTELDCTLYNTSGTVHWEWFGTWTRAIDNFMPQYAKNGIVKSIFPVNVNTNNTFFLFFLFQIKPPTSIKEKRKEEIN
jgi:hypothetical protein